MIGNVNIPVRVQLMHDESLHGYLSRVAHENVFPSARVLHELFGMDTKGLVTKMMDARENLPDISRILAAPEARLADMLPAPLEHERGTFVIHGMELREHSFARRWRRVSPTSLALSPHHRFSWQLVDLGYCRESWELLIDKCPAPQCGVSLGWMPTMGIHVCEKCGFDLRDAKAETVRFEDRALLQLVADIVSTDELQVKRALLQLHPSMQHLNRGTLLQMVNVFGRLHATSIGVRNTKGRKHSLDYPELTVAGARILRGYPSSILEIAERDLDLGATSVFGRIAEIAKTGLTKSTGAFLRQMISDVRPIARSTVKGLSLIRQHSNQMNIREVATDLKIDNAAVRRLVKLGALKAEYIRGNRRQIDWFDRDRVRELSAVMRDRIAVDQVHAELQLPLTAVEQLIALGLLRWHPSEAVAAAYITPCLVRSEFLDFRKKLEESVLQRGAPDANRVTVAECFALTGPSAKPWGVILDMAMRRKLRGGLGVIKASKGFAASNLTVDREVLFQIQSGGTSWLLPDEPERLWCTGLETEERLSCNPSDISELLKGGELKRLPKSGRRFCRASVLSAADALISSREIAARLGMQPRQVAGWAKRWRVRKPDGLPLWRRHEVETFLPPVRYNAARAPSAASSVPGPLPVHGDTEPEADAA